LTAVALAFGLALLLAVLTSAVADRSPLSSSLVFLAVGVVAGPMVLGGVSTEATTVEKAAELLAFATLLDSSMLSSVGIGGWVLAVLVIVVARPAPILVALPRGLGFSGRERLAVAWFGPKGFASVAYAVIVLSSGMDDAEVVFALVTVCVLVSVVAHSSTDVAIARWLVAAGDPPSRASRGLLGPATGDGSRE
jgi:NhaP-type Na+/H+ or K+/H+ antiporter